MIKPVKIIFFLSLFLLMLGTTFWASSHQNLFTEFSFSGSPEWFKATLIDFYINQLIIWIASCYYVQSNVKRFAWLVVFITTGSMGTCLFVLLRILQNKSFIKENYNSGGTL
jgi:hypothetical protein